MKDALGRTIKAQPVIPLDSFHLFRDMIINTFNIDRDNSNYVRFRFTLFGVRYILEGQGSWDTYWMITKVTGVLDIEVFDQSTSPPQLRGTGSNYLPIDSMCHPIHSHLSSLL
jgi:hypothetical protein